MSDERKGPEILDLTVEFQQEADTCDESEFSMREIEIQAVWMGDGHFFRIKTERWAFDDEKELGALVRRVKKMLGR